MMIVLGIFDKLFTKLSTTVYNLSKPVKILLLGGLYFLEISARKRQNGGLYTTIINVNAAKGLVLVRASGSRAARIEIQHVANIS